MAIVRLEDVSLQIPVLNFGAQKLVNKIRNGRRPSDYAEHIDALKGITASFQEGDRVGIIGANGAGKSSLLRVLARIYQPTSGVVSLKGRISSLLEIDTGFEPELTGLEAIKLKAQLMGASNKHFQRNLDLITATAGLGGFINMPTRTYSSGMMMRLSFAVLTCLEPEILIMDEWLSVGDKDFQETAENRLDSAISESKVLFLASHSRELVERVCSKTIWLDQGSVREYGETRDVCSAYFST